MPVGDTGFSENVLAAFREEAGDLLRRADRALHALEVAEAAERGDLWHEAQRALHTLKGSAAAAGAAEVQAAVHALEEEVRTRSEDAEGAGKGEYEPERLDDLLESLERIRDLVEGEGRAAGPPKAAPETSPGTAPGRAPEPLETEGSAARGVPRARSRVDELLRVRPERIDALHTAVGDLVVARLQQDRFGARVVKLRDHIAEALRLCRRAGAGLGVRPRRRTAGRVAEGKGLDALAALLASTFQEAYELGREAPMLQAQAASMTAQVEERVRELRLMQLEPFFEEFTRSVREAARASGRRARLEVEAEGAEIDRAVLVRLREPLLHLVRNAVVHGIETPERRAAAGKPETGRIRLEARCAGPRATIRVVDDGAGVDRDAVLRRAAELGLREGGVEEPSSAELLRILAHPGFSTREAPDTEAGRGVGLNAVAAAVQGLGGELELASEPGRETAFSLHVPVTASTGMGLVVEAAGQRFGILMAGVERIVRPERESLRTLYGRRTVQVDGEPLAAVPLERLVGRETRSAGSGERRPGLVLQRGGQRLALLVDELQDEQAMVIKPLPPAFDGDGLVLGAAVMPDGGILPVLRSDEVFARASGVSRSAHAFSEAEEFEKHDDERAPSVLVVEDSLTMRTLERNLLQGAGYDVTVAHDGRSGLEAFRAMDHCDLVVSDLQMPEMDGIALCRAIRESERPHVPIVMVTSVGDPEERRRSLEAGADAYVVKADFEQEAFLEQVARFTGEAGAPG